LPKCGKSNRCYQGMGRRRMKKNSRIILLVFWVIAIFILTGYPSLKVPTLKHFPIDKLYHFILFFILGLLEYRLLKTTVFFAVGCSVVILAELQQLFVPGREFEILDILFGMIGLISSYIIFHHRSLIRNVISKT